MNNKTITLGKDKWLTVNYADKIVSTHYGSDHVTYGTRPVNYDNIQEARHQGYKNSDDEAVWESLLDHEILHNILPSFLLGEESWVLQHESGKQLSRYALRLHEEALVISFQYWMNTGNRDIVLDAYSNDLLSRLVRELVKLKSKLHE